MDQQVIDRRNDRRIDVAASGLRATLRPGCRVHIVDLSASGALVQAERPLRPGARVHMHVATGARTFTVTARVLRCAVWTLHPSDGVIYRGALQFEHRCEMVGEEDTGPPPSIPASVLCTATRHGHAPTAEEPHSARHRRSGK